MMSVICREDFARQYNKDTHTHTHTHTVFPHEPMLDSKKIFCQFWRHQRTHIRGGEEGKLHSATSRKQLNKGRKKRKEGRKNKKQTVFLDLRRDKRREQKRELLKSDFWDSFENKSKVSKSYFIFSVLCGKYETTLISLRIFFIWWFFSSICLIKILIRIQFVFLVWSVGLSVSTTSLTFRAFFINF